MAEKSTALPRHAPPLNSTACHPIARLQASTVRLPPQLLGRLVLKADDGGGGSEQGRERERKGVSRRERERERERVRGDVELANGELGLPPILTDFSYLFIF